LGIGLSDTSPEAEAILVEGFRRMTPQEKLGAAYLLDGSLASSLHGIPWATQDADLVADLRVEHIAPLIAELGSAFYADDQAMRKAVRQARSFNLIHLASMFKVDVFVAGDDPLVREALVRAGRLPLPNLPGRSIMVASPEDVVIQKLVWYRKGGEISERHWRDAVGVLKIQASGVDSAYLNGAADRAGVAALLARARGEAGRKG
jgi:hypothetical protein